MEARITKDLGSSTRPWVATFHSFCYALMRSDREAFGFYGGILDDADKVAALSAAGFDGPALEMKFQSIDARREKRDGGVAEDVDLVLKETGGVDMVAMVSRVVEALEQNPALLAKVAAGFDDLLVDEYQDVSPLQESLIRVLYRAGVRVWAVGDDDQLIYGFRSADVGHIVEFSSRYPDAAIFAASRNYRCRKPVIEASAKLIAHNRIRVGKGLCGNVDGPPVVARGYADLAAEASAVTSAVSKLVMQGVRPSEIVLLARSNGRLEAYPGVRAAGVATLTAHASKGREWDYVFCVGLEEGCWPNPAAETEEERRIAYVAMTRASSALVMTFAANCDGRLCLPSRFLAEAGLAPFVGVDVVTATPADGALARWPRPGEGRGRGLRSAEEVLSENLRAGEPARKGSSWNQTDDVWLENLFEHREPIEVMAAKLKRTEREVLWRIEMRGWALRGRGRDVVARRSAEKMSISAA
jgi:superfamily I DNA/RNA helicase